jgi:acyl-CoA synthetase (AMP-forming)/AMP-acid ligase II
MSIPAQVKAVLYQHPDVRDACVIGVPDEAQVQRQGGKGRLYGTGKAGNRAAQVAREIYGGQVTELRRTACPICHFIFSRNSLVMEAAIGWKDHESATILKIKIPYTMTKTVS